MDKQISADEFKALLKQYGFSDEDIEKNWQRYLEAVLALSIDDYLKSLPESERNNIVGKDDLNTPEGLELVKTRFLEYYQSHKSEYKPLFNQLNFASKLKEFINQNNEQS